MWKGSDLSLRVIVIGIALATGPMAMADGGQRYGMTAGPPPFTFQGFYIGAHAGLATGDTQGATAVTSTDFNLSGALYGAQIGYNMPVGRTFFGNTILGIEGTWSNTSLQGDTNCIGPLTCKRDVDWVGTVVGRLGVTSGRTLTYGFAGVAWSDANTNVSIAGVPLLAGSATHMGWTAGFGFEHALTNTISAKIEYAHIDLGDKNTSLGGVINDRVDLTMDTVRLGVNIKLSN